MEHRPSHFSRSICKTTLLFIALCFHGCAVIEPGAPVAAVTVHARSDLEVADVVERVFTHAGYRISGRTYDSITFDKEGTRMDRVMYGDWVSGEVAKRARVVVVDKGDGRYRIRCTPLIVRDPGEGDFEDVHRRAQIVSFHYSGLLKQVKKEFR